MKHSWIICAGIGYVMVILGAITMQIYSYGHPYRLFMSFEYAPAWTWICWMLGLALAFFGTWRETNRVR